MNIHLCRGGPQPKWFRDDLELIRASIAEHGGDSVRITDAELADVILAFGVLPSLPFGHTRKAFLYSTSDDLLPFAPGLYPSLHKRNRVPGTAGSPYIDVMRYSWLDEIATAESSEEWLYSFRGDARNAAVRKRLMQIQDNRASVEHVSYDFSTLGMDGYCDFRNVYLSSLRGSLFVLCPRGRGPSTFRLFETMRSGRAPVILSDDWLPPDDVAWDRFVVRVSEQDVMRLPEILRERESEAVELGRRARSAWDETFSAHSMPRWLARQLERLLAERKRFRRLPVICDPRNARLVWRSLRKR